MREIVIGKNEANQRLDRFLLKYLNNSTRANIYKIIRKKLVRVNGSAAKENYFLKFNDKVQIYLSDHSLDLLVKDERPINVRNGNNLDIVYEDDDILVVNKPKGLLVHPDKREYENTLSTIVQSYLKDYSTTTFKPASVNRLDQNTSGLVIFCKNYEALKKYNSLMRERKIRKFYQCIVHGRLNKEGEIKGFLYKDEVNNKVLIKKNNKDGKGKEIHTKYRPLKNIGDYTLIEVELITGRSHQIRASLSNIGHPIIGDTKYGGKKVEFATTQVLHCYKIIVDNKIFIKESEDINSMLSILSKF